MFYKNFLLRNLKQNLHSKMTRAEGVVKSTKKDFGFLEVNAQKSYFISPSHMKKVMHGDRISAVIHTEKEREYAEPEKLIEPLLIRFVGKILKKENYLSILPDYPILKFAIPCYVRKDIENNFKEGDWAVAKMRCHPLKDENNGFYAELTQFIACGEDSLVPWLVTLAKYNLEKDEPNVKITTKMLNEGLNRRDLTDLNFITIDQNNTKDIDDALYLEEGSNHTIHLTVAIADPTAWISEGSNVDNIAKSRAFTNYLPGFNIPMLPRDLSENLCSLQANQVRPVLACRMTLRNDGFISENIEFFAAIIESKAKLDYDDVSDWLENKGAWQPNNIKVAEQIRLLHRIYLYREKWRSNYALIFKDRPKYHFILNEKSEVINIVSKPRRVANRIVEEAMIAANICNARILYEKLGFGIYSVHTGFDPANYESLITLLKHYKIQVNTKNLETLSGFCKLHREINTRTSGYLNNRIRRFQTFSEISIDPGPHFALGLEMYATWTSPIRKYGDMINHRLLKSIIKGTSASRPNENTKLQIIERRRLNRISERNVSSWLYTIFLNKNIDTNKNFLAEIIDILPKGILVQLVDNGAVAFIPATFLHTIGNELFLNQVSGTAKVKGKIIYKVADMIYVNIIKACVNTRRVMACPSF